MQHGHSPARPWLPLPRPTPVRGHPHVCGKASRHPRNSYTAQATRPGWGACRRGAEQGLPEETYRGRVSRVTREVAEKELEAEETDWGNAVRDDGEAGKASGMGCSLDIYGKRERRRRRTGWREPQITSEKLSAKPLGALQKDWPRRSPSWADTVPVCPPGAQCLPEASGKPEASGCMLGRF